MITRQQYLNADRKQNPNYHREYYAQFVNDAVKRAVLHRFSIHDLQQSLLEDEHFNTKLTPIEAWDLLGGFKFSKTTGATLLQPTSSDPIEYKLLKEAGEGFSSSTAVCIYKEAARQILEKGGVNNVQQIEKRK